MWIINVLREDFIDLVTVKSSKGDVAESLQESLKTLELNRHFLINRYLMVQQQ